MSQMSKYPIRVRVDPANPGQFFACCGLLELADRLWKGAEGWFEGGVFMLQPFDVMDSGVSTRRGLLSKIAGVPLQQVDPNDDCSSPVYLPSPFDLQLNWWKDGRASGERLKVWAGSMGSFRIARAMQIALQRPELHNEAFLDYGMIVYDPVEREKKVEPFYFDARRGSGSKAIDIGFSLDSLQMKTDAYPAVEFLCLVGLQRFRPKNTDRPRVFVYHTWSIPLDANLASTAVTGLLKYFGGRAFRFEIAFRTDQRKHKAFTSATPLERRQE